MQELDTDKKIQDFLEKQTQMLKEEIITQEEYNDALRDAKAGLQGYSNTLKASSKSLQNSLLQLGSSLAHGGQGASQFNNALKEGGEHLKNKIPPRWNKWGELLKGGISAVVGFTSAVTKQTDQLFASFQELSRSGAVLGMQDTFANLQSMGYTMGEIGEMQSLVRENSSNLAQFGGTVTEGTKKFAALSHSIVYSQLGTELQRMGMTVPEINKNTMNYVQLLKMQGQLGKLNADEMRVGASNWLLEQDKLTKLTGKSADEQMKVLESQNAKEEYAARKAILRNEGKGAVADMMDSMSVVLSGPGQEDALAGFTAFASGQMNDQSMRFQNNFGEAVSLITAGESDSAKIYEAMQRDAIRKQDQSAKLASAGLGKQFLIDYAATMPLINRSYQGAMTDITNRIAKDQAGQRDGNDKIVANLVSVSQDQRNLAQTSDLLVNKTLPMVTGGMELLAGSVNSVNNIVGAIIGKESQLGGNGTTPPKSPATAPPATPPATATPPSSSLPSGQLGKIVGAESGGISGPNTMGPGGTPASSAYGVGQMLKGTFEDLASKAKPGSALYGKTFEDMKKDVDLQLAATEQYRQQNAAALQKAGFDSTDSNIYLAHVLGTTGALRALRAGNADPISSVVGPAALEKNPQLRALATVSDLKSWAANKTAAKTQSAAMGGILSGPKSGYQAMLHGTEAVVPLPDGRTIPVQIQGNRNQYEQISLLSMELDKLDSMLRVMQQQNDVANRILQRQV